MRKKENNGRAIRAGEYGEGDVFRETLLRKSGLLVSEMRVSLLSEHCDLD